VAHSFTEPCNLAVHIQHRSLFEYGVYLGINLRCNLSNTECKWCNRNEFYGTSVSFNHATTTFIWERARARKAISDRNHTSSLFWWCHRTRRLLIRTHDNSNFVKVHVYVIEYVCHGAIFIQRVLCVCTRTHLIMHVRGRVYVADIHTYGHNIRMCVWKTPIW
jgi:hypothetical protein